MALFLAPLRCILLHPFSTVYYIIKDVLKFFYFKRWREYRKYGTLTIFTGLFGKGKTLALTKITRKIYKKYNNKKVYDFKEKRWKTQHINVVSNVDIKDIPYIQLKSLNDLEIYCDDKYNNGVDVWLFVIDEMSTQINSRDFKTNFTTELLNILLTCRHYRFQIIGSAQRFNHVDALVRQVTLQANECNKLWRLLCYNVYNAWTIENTADVTKVKPVAKKCMFVYDKDYKNYDTKAVVENFKDNVKAGNVLTDSEIMAYKTMQEDVTAPLYLKKRNRKKLIK